jgi:uroporphyrinogen-III synthase
LITRPQEDAGETARLLEARGHQAMISPSMEATFHEGESLTLEGVQAVLATSANGIRALARRTARRAVPVFAVGPQTAAMARSKGFVTVRDADGDADALAQAAQGWADRDKGALLHIRGWERAGLLAENLRREGFQVCEEILYEMKPLDLRPQAAAALRGCGLDAVLFFSPRSAVVFREWVVKENLPTDGLIAVCISAATQTALAPLPFAAVRVAARPNQDALLACLD